MGIVYHVSRCYPFLPFLPEIKRQKATSSKRWVVKSKCAVSGGKQSTSSAICHLTEYSSALWRQEGVTVEGSARACAFPPPSFSLFFMVHLVVRHFSFTAAAGPSVSAILSANSGVPTVGKDQRHILCLLSYNISLRGITLRVLCPCERLLILSLS